MKVFLGLDTSCYTTSVAAVEESGVILSDLRCPLAVPKGMRGLRQEEAVFQHVVNAPRLLEETFRRLDAVALGAVAASVRPTELPESYLPVFRVAEGYGRAVSLVTGAPFLETSHQMGHLEVGLWSTGRPAGREFLAVQISGGTTHFLHVTPDAEGFGRVALVGGTMDIHAGQLVDRIGQAMGLDFPAGPRLDELARTGDPAGATMPCTVRGYRVSFSGPQTKGVRLLREGARREDVAAATLQCIANALEKILRRACADLGIQEVLLVGGVAASSFLRRRLRARLEHPGVGLKLYFPAAELCRDNAVGTALIAREGGRSGGAVAGSKQPHLA